MILRLAMCGLLSLCWTAVAAAQTYTVEILNEAAPADALAPSIAAGLEPTGFKVMRSGTRTICEVWLNKSWPVKGDFQATSEVLYPFAPGQLIGVLRLKNKGHDFRDQDLAAGVYTLRYGLQPVDGAHVGTSPTRDFLVAIEADKDTSDKVMEPMELVRLGKEAAESSHPAILLLQRAAPGDVNGPTIRHNEDRELWIVRTAGKGVTDGKTQPLVIELVVEGVATE